ncbi:hypothetical protein D3C72_1496090 [compost metagenome]
MHAGVLDLTLFDQRLPHIGAGEYIVFVGLERALVILHAELHAPGLAVGIAEIIQHAGALLIPDGAENLDGVLVLPGIGKLAGGLEEDVVAKVALLGVDTGILLGVPDLAVGAFAAGLGLLRRFAGVLTGGHGGLPCENGRAGGKQGA